MPNDMFFMFSFSFSPSPGTSKRDRGVNVVELTASNSVWSIIASCQRPAKPWGMETFPNMALCRDFCKETNGQRGKISPPLAKPNGSAVQLQVIL
jgi:hypothetical protein